MITRRFFTFAELAPSLLFISIAAFIAGQVLRGLFSTLGGTGGLASVSEISVLLALAAIGAVMWRLPNLAWARFVFGMFVLFVSCLLVQGGGAVPVSLSLHFNALDASVLAAFCVLCVWLNVHRWILWNIRHPQRRIH